MAAEPPPVRFGILGCAAIARKVSRAILLSPNSTVVAIGSRSLDKAAAFARDNCFPASAKAYGSYEAVLDDPDVDAVYVPLPTSLHLQWATAAARKKKHLLLDKPVALNVGELDEILAACESSGVQYMDATMWVHHPRTAEMEAILSNQRLFGQLKAVHSVFAYNNGPGFLENDIRMKPDLDALGALGDTGWYCIRAILWASNYRLPTTATALRNAEFNDAGVIMACGASLQYPEYATIATFYCSFLTHAVMEINVVGSNGCVRLHDFVIPFQENVGRFYVHKNTMFAERQLGAGPAPAEHVVTTDLPQEALMVKEFSRLVQRMERGGGEYCDKKWGVISRKTQLVVDAVKVSIETGYVPVEVVE